MTKLTRTDIQHFKHRLHGRRDALGLAATRGGASVDREVRDAGDESVAALLRDVDVSGHERELQELKDIDAALARIATGSFGACLECGGAIARDRLDAYPTAKRCFGCQQLHEKRRTAGVDMSPSL